MNTKQNTAITIAEAAKSLCCSKATLYKAREAGELQTTIGANNVLRISVSALKAYRKMLQSTQRGRPKAGGSHHDDGGSPGQFEVPVQKSDLPGATLVHLSQINRDDGLQVRAALSDRVIADYAQAMGGGEEFPPIVLFAQAKCDAYFIADGWHRLRAAEEIGRATISAEIRIGGRQDALRHALSANSKHGLPRSGADKLKALSIACGEFSDLSNRALAELCCVSESFVRDHRDRCAPNAPDVRTGRDGKTYPSKKMTRDMTKMAKPEARREDEVEKVIEIVRALDVPALERVRYAVDMRLTDLQADSAPPPPSWPPEQSA